MELKRGDILLVHTPDSFICWLIRAVTGSYWNHVAWALGPDLVLEAQAGAGVRLVNSLHYKLDDRKFVKVVRIKKGIISDKQLTAALITAQKYRGSGYDWWLILQLGWLYLRGKIRTKPADDWHSAWICSELIAKPLWDCAGFRFNNGIPPENTVPRHIDESPFVEEIICPLQE